MKTEILKRLQEAEKDNYQKIDAITKRVSITEYEQLTRISEIDGKQIKIWSDALQRALNDNEIVVIPQSEEKYYIDKTVTIPSDRRIEADKNAYIFLTPDTDVLMLRNEHTMDGTHMPINSEVQDCNISIDGGVWGESRNRRLGYRKSGKYNDDESVFYGVSTCMLFNNMTGLTLTNLTVSHAAGFAVQIGNIKNVVCRNIFFDSCYADGIHINGNTECITVQNISGQVGDDLVALNMYDWQNSSVTFGPLKTALVENLDSYSDSFYKALRILPGIYYYDDGSCVDCSINDAIIRNVKGVKNFKLYYQTPPYEIGTAPEKGDAGSGNNIYIEDITVDLDTPTDDLPVYVESDPLRGSFGVFEIGSNIDNLYLKNIDVTLHRDQYPLSYFISVGPKSCIIRQNNEVFDPYVNSKLSRLVLENIKINGKKIDDIMPYINITEFEDINNDCHSTAKGVIEKIEMM